VAVVQFVAAELISLSKYFEVFTGAFDAWNIRHETVAVECMSDLFFDPVVQRRARICATCFFRRAALFKNRSYLRNSWSPGSKTVLFVTGPQRCRGREESEFYDEWCSPICFASSTLVA
jgi:hypothetical protein